MRRPPLGPPGPSAHGLAREHRVLAYAIFARDKPAVVVQQIYIRWRRGQTRDTRFGLMAPRVEALARAALAQAAQSGL
jgi:hypothetical protein